MATAERFLFLRVLWSRMFSHRTDWKLSPNRFTQAQQELRAAGREVLDLTISNPTRAELHYDPETILQALVNPEAMDYDPQPKGLRSAREAVAGYYGKQHNDIDPESILLTTSTSEGYSYVFRLLCNVEDEILVPKPSYPLFEFLADLQDVKLVPYPLLYDHGWQIDFPSLYKAVNHRTRAVVVVHPNNPTGSFVADKERSVLNQFCREYNLALVADEVFLDYAHDGAARATFADNREALTFTLSGLSKISGLPQMKLAWIVTSGADEQVERGTGASGGDCGHVSVDECSHSIGRTRIAGAAPFRSAPGAGSGASEFERTGSRISQTEKLSPPRRRRRMVCGFTGSGYAIRRRPGD